MRDTHPSSVIVVRAADSSDHAWLRTLEEFPWSDVTDDRALTPGIHLIAHDTHSGLRVGALTAADNGDWIELTHVLVERVARRRGVGRELALQLSESARQRGRQRILLEVRQDNKPAIRLYESLGYAEFHRRAGYYADGTTAIEMELRL